MSSAWQQYIDNMKACDAIKACVIVSYPAGDVWAKSADANFKADELKALAKSFDDMAQLPCKGVDLAGCHYVVPRIEENLIFGKKEKRGFFASKTKTAVLLACFEGENHTASEARVAIEKLSEYLTSSGY